MQCHSLRGITVLMLASLALPVSAQVTVEATTRTTVTPQQLVSVRDDRAAHPVLRRVVTLDFERAHLTDALEDVARQAGVRIGYARDIVPRDARVTLRADAIPLGEAIVRLLSDTDLDLLVSPGGNLALVRRPRVSEASEDTSEQVVVLTGSIIGRVTAAATGAGVPGANVLLQDTRFGTTTDAQGRYRLADIPVGEYTLVVERIGYRSESRPVTVAEGAEVTVDFGLGLSPTALDEIVVTGTVVPTAMRALPTPVSVVTAADIERHQVRRIEDLIRLAVPSAVVWEPGSSPDRATMQLSLRGASSLQIANPKLYIDGVETSTRQFLIVDPESIERIEVVRGPQAAATYGSDAMGGVIQVFTKRGGAAQRPELEARASFGRIESTFEGSGALRQEYNLAVRGQAGPASYRVGGGYSRTGDWVPHYRSSVPSFNGGLRIEHGPLALDMSARYYEQNAETPINPLFHAAAPDLISDRPQHTPFQSREETYVTRLEYRPTEWWQNSFTAGLDRYSFSQVQTEPRLTTPADTFLVVGFQHTPKLSLAYHTAVTAALGSGVTATVASGIDHWRLSSEFLSGTATNTTGTLQFGPQGAFVNRSRTTNTGLFTQAQVNVGERFFVTGAVRGEWNSDFGDEAGVPVSPRLGFAYVHEFGRMTLKLRGAYGEAIRSPSPGASEGSVSPFQVIEPNALLKPERQSGPDAGIDLVFGRRGTFSVTHYRQLAKDLITTVTLDASGTPPVYQVQNLARVRNTGWEFEGSLRAGPLALTGQYAFTRSEAEELGPSFSGDIVEGEQLLGVPRHTAAATVTLAPLLRTTLSGSLAYTGARRDYDFLAYFRCLGDTGPCNGFLQGDYLRDYRAFATMNLSLERQLTPGASAFLAVEDLTNNNNERARYTGSPMPGRIVALGARVRY